MPVNKLVACLGIDFNEELFKNKCKFTTGDEISEAVVDFSALAYFCCCCCFALKYFPNFVATSQKYSFHLK